MLLLARPYLLSHIIAPLILQFYDCHMLITYCLSCSNCIAIGHRNADDIQIRNSLSYAISAPTHTIVKWWDLPGKILID